MTASTKKKSATGKASATRKAGSSGVGRSNAVAGSKLDELERASASLPKLIRPTYEAFNVPSDPDGEKVIIKKIPVGPRDRIGEAAQTGDANLDMALFAHHVVAESIVYPVLTFDQINDIDPDDFPVIFDHAYNLSYRKVGEVVKTFPDSANG